MWDWYNRPGGWHDRANVSMRRVALLMVAAGVAMAVFFYVLYALLAPMLYTKVPGR